MNEIEFQIKISNRYRDFAIIEISKGLWRGSHAKMQPLPVVYRTNLSELISFIDEVYNGIHLSITIND